MADAPPARPRRHGVGRSALALVLALALAFGGGAPAAHADDDAILVTARKIVDFDPSAAGIRRFDGLEWLGGLSLVSSDRRFGGLSGLVTTDGGRRLLAVSDYGDWFEARLSIDEAGRPTAVTDARLVRLAGLDGEPIAGKRAGDAEAVAMRRTGAGPEFLVSLETPGHILVYRGDPPFAARPTRLAGPAAIAAAPSNGRGEALAVAPAGTPRAGAVVIFAEAPAAGAATIAGGILEGGRWRPIALAASGGYAATDAAFLPDGDLLVLERRFGLGHGIGMRIRRVPAATVAPGATLDGPVLVEADFGQEIDNMEAMAVDRDAEGRTVLTLLSDDNRSLLQRTLVLRFRLVEGATAP